MPQPGAWKRVRPQKGNLEVLDLIIWFRAFVVFGKSTLLLVACHRILSQREAGGGLGEEVTGFFVFHPL
jgi:hypothetical protein